MSDSFEKLFEQLKRNISMTMFQGDTSLAQWRPTDVIPAPSSGEMIPGRFYMFISDIKYSDSRLVRIASPTLQPLGKIIKLKLKSRKSLLEVGGWREHCLLETNTSHK